MPRRSKKGSSTALGDCYEAAGKYILHLSRLYMQDDKTMGEEAGAEGLILVHAEVAGQGPLEGKTFGHAFVIDPEKGTAIDKSNGRNIELPAGLYMAIGHVEDIDNYYEYTPRQMVDNLIKYKHWGPWDLKTRSGL